MQLTQFTDLGLRVLMYLTPNERVQPVTINEIAEAFNVSRHNLVKVVHFLSQHGWLTTTRGKGGGLALARPPEQYPLGVIIRLLEGSFDLVSCSNPLCALQVGCELKAVLNQAIQAFFVVLDDYTLADLTKNQTGKSINGLHQVMMFRLWG
ncbi:RrF2 family transcriptional regulator [Hydromonas duriensis]|uniref:BadM/Rrf2 family transcriptional regulator n=1 Tax=Hydromonas duriensis TaxID=1527608 RepID=A0A4R6Y1W7_9BURK|nr:Rrf2 family transcriptional regulator [Hydromonas duriensis]TDR30411.1 BadM/Rrf2 family transcriptional regulator [Hydromonas duriensis]